MRRTLKTQLTIAAFAALGFASACLAQGVNRPQGVRPQGIRPEFTRPDGDTIDLVCPERPFGETAQRQLECDLYDARMLAPESIAELLRRDCVERESDGAIKVYPVDGCRSAIRFTER